MSSFAIVILLFQYNRNLFKLLSKLHERVSTDFSNLFLNEAEIVIFYISGI